MIECIEKIFEKRPSLTIHQFVGILDEMATASDDRTRLDHLKRLITRR